MRAEVGIIVDKSFYFGPDYFFTALVEEAAFIFAVVAGLADQTGFTAISAATNCESWTAIDAFRAYAFYLG